QVAQRGFGRDAGPPALRRGVGGALVLDRRSRMLYRGRQLFINGEAASVAAEPALRHLADARALACDDPRCARLSDEARSCLADWLDAGWLRYQP
ncbi:winged helix domain-containing protein, partial [Bordetella pertussis]|uniref:winged helix domain-containing protein n=1 Tax=Bordetella pertussis TaxID=520 RepID=UPI00291C53F7